MAGAAPSPAARLKRLQSIAQKVKDLPRGTKLTSKPMAQLLGVSWVTLRDWCDDIPGFDDGKNFIRGGNGIEWEFVPARTVRFLTKHFEQKLKSQHKKNREIRATVGIKLPASEDTASVEETRSLVNMTIQVVDVTERQHRYMLAEDVANFIEGYNDAVVSGILGVRTKVDPNGNLPPHVRAAMDEELRYIATGVHADAAKYVKDCRARLQSPGVEPASQASR